MEFERITILLERQKSKFPLKLEPRFTGDARIEKFQRYKSKNKKITQELQNEVYRMNDPRDFQDVESVRSGHSTLPVNRRFYTLS